MARPKNESTIVIESFLDKHGVNCTYDTFYQSPEHNEFVRIKNAPIDHIAFNAVKNRIKRAVDLVNIPISLPDFVPTPTNHVVQTNTEIVSDTLEMSNDRIPQIDKNFIVAPNNVGLMDLVEKRSAIENVNVRLVGPAGCGKTSFAMHYAATRKLPVLVMDCANVREPRDWFGYRTIDPSTKNVVWHESLFIKMIETKGAVIVLDELNRVSPLVINTLIPLLDHRRSTYLEEADRTIHCNKSVTFWAAINEGNQFTGTTALDEAVSDRFGLVVECNFLSEDEEVQVLHLRSGLDTMTCRKLVEVATQVRSKCQQHGVDTFSKPISTRMLVEAAKGILLGGVHTVQYTLLNHFSSFGAASSERQTLAKLLMGKFGGTITK